MTADPLPTSFTLGDHAVEIAHDTSVQITSACETVTLDAIETYRLYLLLHEAFKQHA